MTQNMFLELITTFPALEAAQDFARRIVGMRLAACVQIDGPIRSIYRWKDGVQEDQEFRVTIKSRSELMDELLEAVKLHHPYDVPQVWVRRAEHLSQDYADWIVESTGG